jgi:hypothetical protein
MNVPPAIVRHLHLKPDGRAASNEISPPLRRFVIR